MTVILLPHLQLNIHLHRQQQQFQVLHPNIQVHLNICVVIHRSIVDSHHHYVFKQVYHHNVVQHVYGHHQIFILIQCGLFQVQQQQQQQPPPPPRQQHQNDYLYKIHHHCHHHHHHPRNQINVQDDNVVLRNRLIVTFIFCL